jgi:hypothetical protein
MVVSSFRGLQRNIPSIATAAAPTINGALRLQRAESQTVVQMDRLASMLGGTVILKQCERKWNINHRASYNCACQLLNPRPAIIVG